MNHSINQQLLFKDSRPYKRVLRKVNLLKILMGYNKILKHPLPQVMMRECGLTYTFNHKRR